MKTVQQQKSPFPSITNLLNSHLKFQNFFFHFFLICLGLVFGIILSFYLKIFSLNILTTQFSLFSFPPSQLSPPPPPPPSQLSPPPSPPSPPPSWSPPSPSTLGRMGFKEYVEPRILSHEMSDEELLWRASMSPRVQEFPYKRVPKVAFLFLTRGPLFMGPLWDKFFRGNEGLYSIYVHSHPLFNESVPEDSVFFGRRIPSKEVKWGDLNMLQAERRLLANALLDFSNQRFVLLSESCIPLFNFSTIYSYLTNSTKSFISSYDDPGPSGRGRYNRRMNPLIRPEQWRKGSQWFEMDRSLAVEIVSDRVYYQAFEWHCRPSCYVDEHYIPTFVTMKFGERNSNRSLTWVDWSRGGPHPARYGRLEVTVELLERMRSGSECEYNGGNTTTCFLFARKFLPNALDRLLRFAPKLMGFH
ncbi:Core-2/I-branching beta-1,6-N-acetylglucosaminyltransferase family protein isoform 1 [Cinnamomum micranthum f. kanehirae]|uniref:Core-2/I-branching beta-1,6-N-acetylglucosaminyltransferase family protein isoform 1 n=1 Tax=Cinnamomum micranthum f. kanehirae TaxID=337451 RepID=A0A443NUJ8_9MAGN|nr:Core-2/I-branching beta-1,6-N-acetylglucosaminyltransferase family protein isoform 1 [Cinnamomum micranthum f. kanehirae]